MPACATDTEQPPEHSGAAAAPRPVEQLPGAPRRDTPSALVSVTAPGMPAPLVDPTELRPGGPPPDGIPPIDDPLFLRTDEVGFLSPDEAVLSVEWGGETRAYPIQVMIWHEIVNDTFGSGTAAVPVTVTYCPLCNSGIAFRRQTGGEVLDFGTSGLLHNSALVMYDRQTESLWTQFDGRAIAGVAVGSRLERVPASTIAWEDWALANPGSLVLSRDTGHVRPYGQNPYPGYDRIDQFPFAFEGEVDGRLSAKERVLGVDGGTEPVALVLADLLEHGVQSFEVDGEGLVAWALQGTASALEGFRVDEGRDVGATGVFRSRSGGLELTFERIGDSFVDTQTGSTWNVLGRATGGPLAGNRLEPVEHVDTFWFAWAAFAPDTRLI